MKSTYYHRSVILVFVSIVLAGCAAKAAVLPTATPANTGTPTPTATPIPIPILLPTLPPPTPVVTWSPEFWAQQFDKVVQLVNAKDSSCTLPCWWGITPGQTTWSDAKKILDQVGLVTEGYESEKLSSRGLKMYQVGGQKFTETDILQLDIYFYVRDEIVSHIIIGDYLGTPTKTLKQTWSALSPEILVPKLGVPSRVKVSGGCGDSEGYTIMDCSYSLFVFYDARGVYLRYALYTGYGKNYPICPTFGVGGNTENWFRIILKSPDDNTMIENYDEAYYFNIASTFESTTGKTLDDFYQVFLQTDKPPCFYILPSAFPNP